MKFYHFMSYYRRKDLIKHFAKTATWKLVPGFFVLAKNKHNLYWKLKFLKRANCIRYVIAKLSKFGQIRPPQIPFYRGFFEN